MKTLTDLRTVKNRFGGLVRLDYTSYDLPTAHLLLGRHVRQQVHKVLNHRLNCLDPTRIRKLLGQARACTVTLGKKVGDRHLDARLRAAGAEYLDCLAAWSDGAGLEGFNHPALVDYQPLGRLDLAMFLQHDSTGCQTGMYRTSDGSAILWHTEEDVEFEEGSGFDQLRLAAFTVNNGDNPVTIHAFIYPDLLPGPAFGWRSDGYTQAVDTLHTRTLPNLSQGMLANVTTWLTLRLGAALDVGEVIKSMQPYYDGYALNTIYAQAGEVQAHKYEFAADRIFQHHLDERPDSYLFQVNIFSDRAHPWVVESEDLQPDWSGLFEQRVERTQAALQNKNGKEYEVGDMRFFFDLITSRAGDGWAYANPEVKAYFIHHQSIQGAEIWLGDGPALPDDNFTIIKTSFD